MQKLARFIVKYRLWLFLAFIVVAGYCVYGVTRIRVEYDITTYLPGDTDTAKAITIMAEEFEESGSASIMVRNIEKADAVSLAAEIGKIDGVASLTFDAESKSNYSESEKCALYSIFFVGGKSDARAVAAYDATVKLLNDGKYGYCVPTPLNDDYAKTLADEMVIIIAIAAAVIIGVLLFTSKSFAEVLAFPAVFVIAALLNMGTNHWLGKISFVSNTVCIILQLALAIDYAIILCHRFTEEKDKNPGSAEDALVAALTHAIPEIASGSLTTVSGLVALMFMQLRLGFDLGMVLAKSIICSLLTVFFFMPCILMWLSKIMDKSRHRNLVPKVRFLGAGAVKLRYVFLGVFVVLFGLSAWGSQNVTYCYSQNSIDTSRPTATATAQAERDKVFGADNAFVILVPKSVDPQTQRAIVAEVEKEELITSALGWASVELPSRTEAGKSYHLTDEINCDDLVDIAGVDDILAQNLFVLYASAHGEAGGINADNIAEYRVEAGELFSFAFDKNLAGGELAAFKSLLELARGQLIGKNHYRTVFNINATVESRETFALIERLTPKVKSICADATFAGGSMSAYDLNGSFKTDNLLISLLTVAFIYVILAVTFRSWGIPIVLVAVIQGAIFMNFSLPVIMGNNVFFFVYLIASAIQMGATIDYAILLTNRFRQFVGMTDRREAVKSAVSAAFPTVMTSGTIMTVASYLVGFMTSDPLISSMGMILGSGTLISIACVLTVLPAALYVLGPLLEKTVFKLKRRVKANANAETPKDEQESR